MQKECPGELEERQMRLAIQRSLMDTAIEFHRGAPEISRGAMHASDPAPEDVLGLHTDAGLAEIRHAYRMKALAAHPDKGGDSAEFCRVQRAYRTLVAAANGTEGHCGDVELLALPASDNKPCQDFQLKNHRELVKQKFKEDGVDLEKELRHQRDALERLALEAEDQGATNTNEHGTRIYNQCFYLSLARSYSEERCKLTIKSTALQLKRVIEAAVLTEHPDWGGERVGEDVQAFADFLVFVLGTNALLSELAVAIFDIATGGVEVYVGRCFPGRGREAEQRSNLLTLQYTPGHYRALVSRTGLRPSFRELLDCLENLDMRHVVTYV
jgi:hypothetical protein